MEAGGMAPSRPGHMAAMFLAAAVLLSLLLPTAPVHMPPIPYCTPVLANLPSDSQAQLKMHIQMVTQYNRRHRWGCGCSAGRHGTATRHSAT